ncbi:MAG: hypothetical protein RML56_08790 [Burkholderiales bacterium]|nr:hypothetical protein [Burkholderiales bacterium]
MDGARSLSARRQAVLALAASFVLVAVGVFLLVPKPEKEEPAFRGIERPQTLLADDPARAAESLARDLEALGLAPRVTRQEDATLVESPWPKELEDRHRALLARHYLRPPEGTRLAVEVRKRP